MTPSRTRSAPNPVAGSTAPRVRVARIAAAAAQIAARLRGGHASVFPGYVALKISPDILSTLLADRALCLVSGTNGKTTTTALVAAMLGDTVTTNKDGANLPAGWVSALLDDN